MPEPMTGKELERELEGVSIEEMQSAAQILDSQPRKAICDNCGWEGTNYLTLDECEELHARLEPGCEIPAGDCPECQCFCYLEQPKDKRVVIVVRGGLIEDVFSNVGLEDIQVQVIDSDNAPEDVMDERVADVLDNPGMKSLPVYYLHMETDDATAHDSPERD